MVFLAASIATHGAAGGFSRVTGLAGIHYRHYAEDFEPATGIQRLTGGAAAGDYDGDGWVDLFVTRLDDRDILYRNRGAHRLEGEPWFEDVSLDANLQIIESTNGAAWGDIDNDGDLDLFVTAVERSRFYLYVNQGDGTFLEEGELRATALSSPTDHNGFSVTLGDYNRDGWLDIHTCEWGISKDAPGVENHTALLKNLGPNAPGFFRNVTLSAGVRMKSPLQYAFSSAFTDLDGDHWPDLAVVSDFQTSQLFWNNRDGTFTDGTESAGINRGTSEMGSAIADFDRDGLLDWFTTGIEDNRFYRNLGNRSFSEEAEAMGIKKGGWGWGTQLFDMDNDGDLDLIMTNGYHPFGGGGGGTYPDDVEPDVMRLWRNDDGVFTDAGWDMGIRDDGEGKGLLVFDYDRDGDQDVFVTNNGETSTLYRNDINSGNSWLQLSLRSGLSNRFGIGSKVTVVPKPQARPQYYELTGANNFLGQSENIIQVGLGGLAEPVFLVEVLWPSGRKQVLGEVEVNQSIVLEEPPLFTYSQWAELAFNAPDLENLEISGLRANPDHDGFSNLWEYVFGLNPQVADSQTPYVLTPSREYPDSYRLTYLRTKHTDDVEIRIDWSPDTVSWEPLTGMKERVVPAGGRDRVTLAFSRTGPFFIRMRGEWLE